METFVAIVVLISGPKHQTRFFGEFPNKENCVKFYRWQVRAAIAQNLEILARCEDTGEFLKSHSAAFIEEPTT